MILPNRKCPIGLVIVFLTGGQYFCEAQDTAACIRSGVINVQHQYGHIASDDTVLNSKQDCQLWNIRGKLNDTILIRISIAHFDKVSCAFGSNLILGPLPFLDICNLSAVNLPVIYRSKRDHVWIQYLTGSQPWDSHTETQFAMEYVTSSSSSCSFRCIFDGTCIPKEWQCNGQAECSKGEDEYMCDSTTENDEPPHAVTSPDVVIQYPQTSFTLYGDKSTDDQGIVKYTWTKTSTDALGCDMQGTHTSHLHLSNLQIGEYTFRLTVSDRLGQTSTADVHVKVKQASYHEPSEVSSSKNTTRTSTTTKACFHCYVLEYEGFMCLPNHQLCDGIANCRYQVDEDQYACESKYGKQTTIAPESVTCGFHEIYCYVSGYRRPMCLHNMFKCDGNKDCAGGEDENPSMCGDRACNTRIEEPFGWFSSPNLNNAYPEHTSCSWIIHKLASRSNSTIQLRVVFFSLVGVPETDFVKVYDGPDSTYNLIGAFDSSNPPPPVIESSANWMYVVFQSDYTNKFHGFNFTHQIKGVCLPSQSRCVGENDCYDSVHERCNGVWNCPLYGRDETGCGNCKEKEFTCGIQTRQCYQGSERCNGLARCSNSFDEINCTSKQCGTHNGTFLCNNRRCIYESWTCDERDDCGDNSDEQFCAGTTKRVVIAAICGSMICALLLVILLGCSCKLYSLRTMDHHQRYPRHETPMSRLYAEFLRRRAPPPYHEAMLTSRNFDEVQQEYLERMQNSRRNHRGSRGNRRRSRNQQNQSQAENVETNENQTNVSDNINEGAIGVQLCTINEENENNMSTGRTSSTAELLPSESETESDDIESETDLAEQDEGRSGGQSGSNITDRVTGDDNIYEDDDENILVSTSLSAQWMTNVDSDDSSDDACILDSQGNERSLEALHSRGQGNDNVSVDTEATTSIASMEQQEIPNNVHVFKDSENESDSDEDALENSRNSTPKPDSNHGNVVITETSGDYITRANSHGSLNSIGSETHSETDVPLLPMNSVVSQHF